MSSVFVKNQPGETFKLNNIDYFYDHIRREFCDEILTNDGDFLVRKGHHGSETDLVISVRVLGEVKHCKPNRKENGVRNKTFMINFNDLNIMPKSRFLNSTSILTFFRNTISVTMTRRPLN